MAIRVGIDMVSADRVREAASTHGRRYLERVYSARELNDCRTDDVFDAHRLAARFAAKEATFKVLRVGVEAVTWLDVEVCRDPSGWTDLLLYGSAATLAKAVGITDLSLSLTHEEGYGAAVVVAMINRPGRD